MRTNEAHAVLLSTAEAVARDLATELAVSACARPYSSASPTAADYEDLISEMFNLDYEFTAAEMLRFERAFRAEYCKVFRTCRAERAFIISERARETA